MTEALTRTRQVAARHLGFIGQIYPSLLRSSRVGPMRDVAAASCQTSNAQVVSCVLDVGMMIFAFDDLCDEGQLTAEELGPAVSALSDIAAGGQRGFQSVPLGCLVGSLSLRLRKAAGSREGLWRAWCAASHATLRGLAASRQLTAAPDWEATTNLDEYLAATASGMGVGAVYIAHSLSAGNPWEPAPSISEAVVHLEAASRIANDLSTVNRDCRDGSANALLLRGVTLATLAHRLDAELSQAHSLLRREPTHRRQGARVAERFARACIAMYEHRNDGFNPGMTTSREARPGTERSVH